MFDKMVGTHTNGTNGNHIHTAVDPLFQSIVKKQTAFLIWRVEVSHLLRDLMPYCLAIGTEDNSIVFDLPHGIVSL